MIVTSFHNLIRLKYFLGFPGPWLVAKDLVGLEPSQTQKTSGSIKTCMLIYVANFRFYGCYCQSDCVHRCLWHHYVIISWQTWSRHCRCLRRWLLAAVQLRPGFARHPGSMKDPTSLRFFLILPEVHPGGNSRIIPSIFFIFRTMAQRSAIHLENLQLSLSERCQAHRASQNHQWLRVTWLRL